MSRSVVIHQLSKRRSQTAFSKTQGLVQCVLFHPVKPCLFVAVSHSRIFLLVPFIQFFSLDSTTHSHLRLSEARTDQEADAFVQMDFKDCDSSKGRQLAGVFVRQEDDVVRLGSFNETLPDFEASFISRSKCRLPSTLSTFCQWKRRSRRHRLSWNGLQVSFDSQLTRLKFII